MVRICETCGKEHDGKYGSGRFCSKECARKFSTLKDNKGDLKIAKCIVCGKETYINKRKSEKYCKCDKCLQSEILLKKQKCKYFTIDCNICYFNKVAKICKCCKSSIIQQFSTLVKYCNFKISDYEQTIQNYKNLKTSIQYLIDNGYSAVDICTYIFGSPKKGNTVFKILNIKCKSLSEAVVTAFLQGKFNNIELWHKTWEGNEIYLRSTFEQEYANYLDIHKISYTYENLKIKYFDTQKNRYRLAIPDFYLPSTNTIVEIKSSWTLDVQEMKDKVKEYKKLGYNFKLILDHKETDLFSL